MANLMLFVEDDLIQWRPTVTVWNRLEGRTRAEDFDRAMQAEVHDALWMLSRQWQMGEFIGDDAGSPVLAKAHMATTLINKYKPGDGPVQPFDNEIPLEVMVEHQAIPFKQAGQEISLDIRLLMGRQWLKWLSTIDSSLKQDYINEYDFKRPDPDLEADARICAHVKVWQQFAAVAGRQMDGYKLYEYLKMNPANHAYDDIPAVDDAIRKNAIDGIALKFIDWYEKLYYQPIETENTSWRPEYLEHQFSCSAPLQNAEKIMIAEEYYHGHLDWYNLDLDPDQTGLGEVNSGEEGSPEAVTQPEKITRSFIPSSVTFGGMPHSRWWKFENWQTDLSFIKPDTTDLNKLLLLDFMLVYSNDWYLVPFTLPTGSIANVKGLSVKNVFGEHIWVEPAGAGSDEDWQRWNMYSLNLKGDDDIPADLSLVVLPAAKKVMEGKPLEEIFLLRDEIANMVWGVESQVPTATGKSMPGKEAGNELRNKLQQLLGEAPEAVLSENDAKIRYQVVNSVPEQWVPFVPVHLDDNKREIQLQRASMPRILENNPGIPLKIEPRTSLLREGLDLDTQQPYFLHEEEVPKAGIQIKKSFQRTRWFDGSVYTWVGIRKQIGRGGGNSGLKFDQVIPLNK